VNVQNIPRDWKEVKECFLPKLDCFLFADLKNIEPRLIAFFAAISDKASTEYGTLPDPTIAELFRQGFDPYVYIAEQVGYKDITPTQRDLFKTCVLAMAYGGGVNRIRDILTKSEAFDGTPTQREAAEFLGAFREALPSLFALRERCKAVGADRGFLRTPWGRHLHVVEPHKALNQLIQGSAADYMKWCYLQVKAHMEQAECTSHIVNIIHDELVLDCVDSEVHQLAENIPSWMVYDPVNEVVPILVDIEYSDTNWAEKREYTPWT
jgi:DNA polymerase-1